MAAAKYLGSNERCQKCGRQLRASNRSGFCSQAPECKAAGRRKLQKQRWDELKARRVLLIVESAIEVPLAKYWEREPVTCELCGRPTRSKTGVCAKNPVCRAEQGKRHQRLYLATPEGHARRLETVRRESRAAGPRVYAVYFPGSRIAKIGFTDTRAHVSGAAGQLRETAVDLWQRPGDYRHEAYIQACLSFEFPQVRPPARQRKTPARTRSGPPTRLSEWFDVSDVTSERLIVILDDLYEQAASLDRGNSELRPLRARGA